MHPNQQELMEFALAELGESRRTDVAEHLDGCRACTGRVAEYRHLFEVMRTDRSSEPPAAWVERAVGLRKASPVVERIREWCADRIEGLGRVVFDSFASPGLAAAGARGVETERRLRFRNAEVELELRVEPTGVGGRVTGQASRLPAGEPLSRAEFLLTSAAREAVSGQTDEFGEFSVEVARREGLCLRIAAGSSLAVFEFPGDAPESG